MVPELVPRMVPTGTGKKVPRVTFRFAPHLRVALRRAPRLLLMSLKVA